MPSRTEVYLKKRKLLTKKTKKEIRPIEHDLYTFVYIIVQNSF